MRNEVIRTGLDLKIDIHEIHQNLRNPVSILIKLHPLQQNPPQVKVHITAATPNGLKTDWYQ